MDAIHTITTEDHKLVRYLNMTMDIIHIYIYRHPGVQRIWKFEKTHYRNGNDVKKLVSFTSGLLYNYIQVCIYIY